MENRRYGLLEKSDREKTYGLSVMTDKGRIEGRRMTDEGRIERQRDRRQIWRFTTRAYNGSRQANIVEIGRAASASVALANGPSVSYALPQIPAAVCTKVLKIAKNW